MYSHCSSANLLNERRTQTDDRAQFDLTGFRKYKCEKLPPTVRCFSEICCMTHSLLY